MLNRLKKQLHQIPASIIRIFNEEASAIPNCISLTLGEPQFDTPIVIKEAMKQALDVNHTHYASTMGDLDLRRKIADYEWRTHQLLYDTDEIMISIGASEALSTALATIIQEGDEIIVPTPSYPQYEAIIQMERGIFVPLNTQDHDFQITDEELKRCISDKTKAIILNTPNNPSGSIYNEASLALIYEWIRDKKIFVLCDEVYEQLIYEPFVSFMKYQANRQQLIAVKSFSKPYAMTGWRLGYLMADREILAEMVKVHQYRVSCVPTFVQKAGIVALDVDITDSLETYRKHRDYAYERLIKMGLNVNLPSGAFYLFPKIEEFGLDSYRFCQCLMHEVKVACVPGSCFHAEGYLRISTCVSMKQLAEGLNRLESFIQQLRNN